MNPRNSQSYDDDIDDIMASIMQGKSSSSNDETSRRFTPRASKSRARANRQSQPKLRLRKPSSNDPKAITPRRTLPIKLVLPMVIVLLITGSAGALFWKGPLSSLLATPSPFSAEIKSKMGIPLYYPTKLPGDYKIELGSIAQPESSVTVFGASDNSGNKIHFSLQKKPSGLTLEPLYKILHDTKNVDTKFGVIVYGSSDDNLDIANVIVDNTWLIITYSKDLLRPEDVQTLVNSLEAS